LRGARGGWLALLLAGCGASAVARELRDRRAARPQGWRAPAVWAPPLALTNALASARRLAGRVLAAAVPPAGAGALAWTALKVGALAFGGGFVIVPLMQSDAVDTYHWMTHAQFLDAVALGQLTPGPVTLTVASVGYAAAGIAGGLLASLVAFAPRS